MSWEIPRTANKSLGWPSPTGETEWYDFCWHWKRAHRLNHVLAVGRARRRRNPRGEG